MGIRLLILGWWTPSNVIRRELSSVSHQTTMALESILAERANGLPTKPSPGELPMSIEDQRAEMAERHARLVEELEKAVGREEAVKIGREALFRVGENLGKEARGRLAVGESSKDMITAAKILYRVLGIRFHLVWRSETEATVIVDECALSKKYSELTCKVLSATDEGVIKGLQPSCTMKFQEYMTSGCGKCKANIAFNLKEKTK